MMFNDNTALNLDNENLKTAEKADSLQDGKERETVLPFSLDPKEQTPNEPVNDKSIDEFENLRMDSGEDRYFSYRPEYAGLWQKEARLVPSILADIAKNFLTYFLGVVLCALSLYKVYQVQETRDLTARYNEVMMNNENLHKEWLSLLAQRQTLSEQSAIREAATTKLKMIAPKTEAEQVININ